MNNITKTFFVTQNYADIIHCALNNPFVPEIQPMECKFSNGGIVTIEFDKRETGYMPMAKINTPGQNIYEIDLPQFNLAKELTVAHNDISYTMIFKVQIINDIDREILH